MPKYLLPGALALLKTTCPAGTSVCAPQEVTIFAGQFLSCVWGFALFFSPPFSSLFKVPQSWTSTLERRKKKSFLFGTVLLFYADIS